jgi:hypothetical protein
VSDAAEGVDPAPSSDGHDPALRGRTTVRLLLPTHYRDRPEVRWPSLYLLHGCCDSYISWTRSTDIEQLSAVSDVLTTPLFISVGNGQPGPLNRGGALDRTEQALHAENLAFRARLTQLGAAATFDFYGPGSHDCPYWQRELHRAWPLLTNALVRVTR